MGKIYVVTEGEYDDYRILGVTTDRAVAERLVELHDDGWYTPDIEEYDDTTIQDIENEKPAWNVRLYDDGEIFAERRPCPFNADDYYTTITKFNDYTAFIVPGNTKEEAIEEAKKRRDEYDSNS